jgi:hypothetical protein
MFLAQNFKLFSTSLVHYMFRRIWSSSGASTIAVENCCTSVVTLYKNTRAHKRGYTLELYSLTEVHQ